MEEKNKKGKEVGLFLIFLKNYFQSRLIYFGINFEKIKKFFVFLLIIKRGKYSQSFLNTSFFILVFASFVSGSVILENHPFIARYFTQENIITNPQVFAVDFYEMPIATTFSQKPRDKIVDYQVKEGDTLESIANKFDISIDTIKWANNLKSDLIKPGQILKIPPVTGVVHKVAAGETIYSIAKKYKTDPQKIVNFPFNDFADLETFTLRVGQILYVPDGVIEEAKPIKPQFIAQVQAGSQGSSNFIWPASGVISQGYVWYHQAIDIANPAPVPILASDGGKVVYAGCVGWGYGCHIVIDHQNGYQTLYAHLSSINVSVGEKINQGQIIGNMGCTGRCTGTHLHFEIRSNGILLNPLSFLK